MTRVSRRHVIMRSCQKTADFVQSSSVHIIYFIQTVCSSMIFTVHTINPPKNLNNFFFYVLRKLWVEAVYLRARGMVFQSLEHIRHWAKGSSSVCFWFGVDQRVTRPESTTRGVLLQDTLVYYLFSMSGRRTNISLVVRTVNSRLRGSGFDPPRCQSTPGHLPIACWHEFVITALH